MLYVTESSADGNALVVYITEIEIPEPPLCLAGKLLCGPRARVLALPRNFVEHELTQERVCGAFEGFLYPALYGEYADEISSAVRDVGKDTHAYTPTVWQP